MDAPQPDVFFWTRLVLGVSALIHIPLILIIRYLLTRSFVLIVRGILRHFFAFPKDLLQLYRSYFITLQGLVKMVDWVGLAKGLFLPVAYLTLLIGSLAVFSSLYRKRKAASSANLEPWFASHTFRDIYLTLLHMEPPAPDSLLKAALLERACEDIRRILNIRKNKAPLNTLVQRGSVGDDLWQRLTRAEKEVELELRDVVDEANALQEGWGQTIFQSANEMVNNEILREKIGAIQARGEEDIQWWAEERVRIQSEFMQELDDEEGAEKGKSAAQASSASPEVGSDSAQVGSDRMGNSDEDAVLVEGGGPEGQGTTTPGGGGTDGQGTSTPGGGNKKKKKGKK